MVYRLGEVMYDISAPYKNNFDEGCVVKIIVELSSNVPLTWNFILSFQPDCMYYWTHTQTAVSEKVVQDVNKLPPMWPPNLNDSPEKPGLKYTEAGK